MGHPAPGRSFGDDARSLARARAATSGSNAWRSAAPGPSGPCSSAVTPPDARVAQHLPAGAADLRRNSTSRVRLQGFPACSTGHAGDVAFRAITNAMADYVQTSTPRHCVAPPARVEALARTVGSRSRRWLAPDPTVDRCSRDPSRRVAPATPSAVLEDPGFDFVPACRCGHGRRSTSCLRSTAGGAGHQRLPRPRRRRDSYRVPAGSCGAPTPTGGVVPAT